MSAHAQKRPQRQRNVHDATGGHHLRGPEVLSKAAPGAEAHFASRTQKTRKHKHLVLKWVLGIFAALIAAGIGLFAYMYTTTKSRGRKVRAGQRRPCVHDDATPIGSYAEQNRAEIVSCADLPDFVGSAIGFGDRSFYTNGASIRSGIARAFYNNLTTGSRGRAVPPSLPGMRNAIIWAKPPRTWSRAA